MTNEADPEAKKQSPVSERTYLPQLQFLAMQN